MLESQSCSYIKGGAQRHPPSPGHLLCLAGCWCYFGCTDAAEELGGAGGEDGGGGEMVCTALFGGGGQESPVAEGCFPGGLGNGLLSACAKGLSWCFGGGRTLAKGHLFHCSGSCGLGCTDSSAAGFLEIIPGGECCSGTWPGCSGGGRGGRVVCGSESEESRSRSQKQILFWGGG
ncbi:unnamed protein product, partial [Bubo scandiacus]